jgi:flagellar basal body-associated protein FliL
MTYLLFATALGLSACAAYYSVMGLLAIFAAAPIPIFIMGSLLEASKLVVASWLYRSWKQIPVLMKSYFTIALVVLMMLTSMGIFGYLSKAHLDQAIPTGDVAAKLALIDEKIKTEKENLNASRKELNQLDQQVDQTISRTTDAAGTDRAIAIRRGQQKDRNRILNEIGQTQTKISKLNEERAPIASEARKVEAEVGPIKYIAAIIYGDNPDADILEKAVRIVIIMIVIVFDPLAVLLLVAANWNQKQQKEENPGLEVFAGNPEVVVGTTSERRVEPDVTPPEPEPLPEESKNIIKDFFKKKDDEPHSMEVSVSDDVQVKEGLTIDIQYSDHPIAKRVYDSRE